MGRFRKGREHNQRENFLDVIADGWKGLFSKKRKRIDGVRPGTAASIAGTEGRKKEHGGRDTKGRKKQGGTFSEGDMSRRGRKKSGITD